MQSHRRVKIVAVTGLLVLGAAAAYTNFKARFANDSVPQERAEILNREPDASLLVTPPKKPPSQKNPGGPPTR